MPSGPCDALNKQGYLFFSPESSAALKPCLWCKRALAGGEMCYKHQFYGIDSHRCVQLTPTLKCNQRCLFCWRSFEHEAIEVRCDSCGYEGGVESIKSDYDEHAIPILSCPKCKGSVKVPAGQSCCVKNLRIVEAD